MSFAKEECFIISLHPAIKTRKERKMPEKSARSSPKKRVVPKKESPGTPLSEAGASPKKTSKIVKKKNHDLLPEENHRMVAETAYFIAECRGFSNGSCEEDWYRAEQIVMQSLSPE